MIELELEKEESDINDLVNEVLNNRFVHTAPLPKEPPYLIKIGDKGIAMEGSLIEISGMPKTRKSSLMAMIAAAILSKERNYMDKIHSFIKGKKVLWFDTEQSDIEVSYFQNHIIDMAGLRDPEHEEYVKSNYFALKLRPYDEETRLRIVDRIITAPDVFNDVGALFLDGSSDLLLNVNDMDDSKALVTRLTYWADYLKVPLFTGLHTNKDGKASTGSFGGFLDKKCSYHIRVEKEFEDSPSYVKTLHARNGQKFTSFMISNTPEGRPILVDKTEIGEFAATGHSRSNQEEATFGKVETWDQVKDGEDTDGPLDPPVVPPDPMTRPKEIPAADDLFDPLPSSKSDTWTEEKFNKEEDKENLNLI